MSTAIKQIEESKVKNKKSLSLYLSIPYIKRMDALCDRFGVTRTVIVEAAIQALEDANEAAR